MSYHAEAYEDYDRPWFLKKSLWIIAAVILCLLAAGVGIFTYVGLSKIPDVGGGLTIEADPDTRIYIGDKLVGTGKVSYSWEQVFGDENHEPVAIEQLDPETKVTPELLSGPGAEVLHLRSLGPGSGVSSFMTLSGHKYLIRRADRSLDQVIVFVFDWKPVHQSARRFILPVRIRKGTIFYFNEAGSSSFSSQDSFERVFGRPPIEIIEDWKFSSLRPPGKFAEEIKTKGLWEPGGEK